MKSEWKVSSNFINDKKIYCAYRNIDTAEIDHSGNREYHGEWTDNRDEVRLRVEKLNLESEK
ncbi:MAG: hypothetical protein GT589_03690 [Peptoclostridium sp.]|uniref:hypothetical protein n=1 Tax=Peptoclostridium sp. TaxID=1904860 RepID=UPI00139B9395|nr:hypothetical protein [Peptoclostridium sp.]MZQ75243.1 hypothetical protein [Peptoclostridium sp.]